MSIKEMIQAGVTDGTIRVHEDCPAHPGEVGVIRNTSDICESAPLFRVHFPDGERDLFMDDEVDVLECHPIVKFLLDLLNPRFWLAISIAQEVQV